MNFIEMWNHYVLRNAVWYDAVWLCQVISKSQLVQWVWTRTHLSIDLLQLVCSRLALSSLFSKCPLLIFWDVSRLLHFIYLNLPPCMAASFSSLESRSLRKFCKIFKSAWVPCGHVWSQSMNVYTRNALHFTAELDRKWWRISSVVLSSSRSLESCFATASKLCIQQKILYPHHGPL